MALETVNSPKVKAVADKLSTMAMENGAYWYEYQGPNADLDTTGWPCQTHGHSPPGSAARHGHRYLRPGSPAGCRQSPPPWRC